MTPIRHLPLIGLILLSFTFPASADDNIQIRMGKKGESQHLAKTTLSFEGKLGATVEAALDVEGQTYTVVVISKTAGAHSTHAHKWHFHFYRGSKQGEEITRHIEPDPKESGALGNCGALMSYNSTDGLWIEIGVEGAEFSAEDFCAKNSPLR